MKIQANEGHCAGGLHEVGSGFAGRPSVVLAIPDFDAQELVGPRRLERFPGVFSGRVSENGKAFGSFYGLQHFQGRQILSEERHRAPNENMDAVGRVAIFDARQNEDCVGTCFCARLAILREAFRSKAAVVFGHHQDAIATSGEPGAEIFERPGAVVGPFRMHVTGSEDFHLVSFSGLKNIAV